MKKNKSNNKKNNKMTSGKLAKVGANYRWASRISMLEELRKFIDSELYPLMVKWKTEDLKTLLKYIHKNGK